MDGHHTDHGHVFGYKYDDCQWLRFANVVPRNAIGYAVGIDYVPYDNFPALLHQGEQVLTAEEARSGNGGSGGVQIIMNGVTIREDADIDRVAAALLQKMELAGMRG